MLDVLGVLLHGQEWQSRERATGVRMAPLRRESDDGRKETLKAREYGCLGRREHGLKDSETRRLARIWTGAAGELQELG